jgi:hypothetical protein
MWLFYALAGPIALGMVTGVLQYFAARTVPLHVRLIVGYAWFCTISIIVLVPADIWTVSSAIYCRLFAVSYLLGVPLYICYLSRRALQDAGALGVLI